MRSATVSGRNPRSPNPLREISDGWCKRFARKGSSFPLSPQIESCMQLLSATFVPGCGIFRHTRTHQSTRGRAYNDSFIPLGVLKSDFLPFTSRSSGVSPAEMMRPSSLNRNCTRIRAVAGLTCLSVRCLSSYLIFSASSSDKQAAARFAGARLG